jgi:hypothetical protein
MKDTLYKTVLLYTKLSPPIVEGILPKIGRKKVLEKLAKHNITEQQIDKSEKIENGKVTYSVWLERDLLLEIKER